MYERPGRPSDLFKSPFPNDNAAKAANGGALPPDLSLITKARLGGPDYTYGILTGYHEPPEGLEMQPGLTYNAVFPGHQIAMPPPLSDDAVEYADGTPATVEQMSHDVVTFLAWAAEPEMEARKRTGVKVLLFLIVFTGLLYATKRKIWAKVH
jgi:ubiquinol-cytochrome c reductase cytochrome c1 subunit